jgi:L-iditol 2-dehydrogenase
VKGAVLYGPKDVRYEDVPEPVPGPGEIVLRTLAAFSCGTDRKVVKRGYHARMLKPPCVFGHEAAGEVVAVGEGVASFAVGDRVLAANSAPCGECRPCMRGRLSLCGDLEFWNGSFAERFKVPARVVARNVLPLGGVAAEDAAMTEPLACCVKGLADADVRSGDRVLVIGSGSIGLMLARLGVLRGAEMTLAARRAEGRELARAQGVRSTVEIREDANGAAVLEAPAESRFDVVFDAGGVPETASLSLRSAAPGGTVSLFAGPPSDARIELDPSRVHYEELRIIGSFHHTPAAFREAFGLIRDGAIRPRDFVSARLPLSELPNDLMNPKPGTLKTLVVF